MKRLGKKQVHGLTRGRVGLAFVFATLMTAMPSWAEEAGSGFMLPNDVMAIASNGSVEPIAGSPGRSIIGLETGGGRMIRLDKPAAAVYVANPDIADVELKSPKLLFLYAKTPGETTVYAVDKSDNPIVNGRVIVEHNLTRLREMIKQVHPSSDVRVASLKQTIVLTGTVEGPDEAENIRELAEKLLEGEDASVVNRLNAVAPNQVNLRVRIAEVSRDISKELGFNWDILKASGDIAIGFSTGAFLSGVTTGSTNLGIGIDAGGLDINALIDALDDQGLITVLAEPNLTSLSGEAANFLAGGEFPIPVAQDEDGITIEFREFGVSLGFLPIVLANGTMHISVTTEVSQLSAAGAVQISGFSVPALTTRKAETSVRLGSGQSFAIAGLLQNTTNQNVSRVPGLGDLPVLGALFRSNDFQRQESELVVIVTPYIVRPSSGKLAAPTDGFVPPSDGVQNFTGATHEQRLHAKNAAPLDPIGVEGGTGPAGFILR